MLKFPCTLWFGWAKHLKNGMSADLAKVHQYPFINCSICWFLIIDIYDEYKLCEQLGSLHHILTWLSLYLNYLHLINDDICCRTAPAACSTHSNYQECKQISNLASDSSGRPESWKFQLLHWKWRKMQKIGLGTKFLVTILVVISPSQL